MTRRTTLFYCYLFLIYTFCVHLPSLNVEVFYMHLYNKEQAIKRMNQLGQLHRPFIFIINYLQDVSYIEEVAAVDSAEVLYNLNGFTNQIISAEDDIATYSAKTVPSLHGSLSQNLSLLINVRLISCDGTSWQEIVSYEFDVSHSGRNQSHSERYLFSFKSDL